MKKNTLKYIIDSCLFILVSSSVMVGLLLAFVIPEGRSSFDSHYFLGLHRHDWRTIHLYLSIIFSMLLGVHLWFNRVWIVQFTRQFFGDYGKNVLWMFSGAWLLVLLIAWMIMK